MRPLSPLYYIKENKIRSLIVILMLFFTTLLYLAGNYIDSVYYYWDSFMEYSDKMCVVSALSTDEDYKEFEQFYNDLLADDSLIVMPRTPWGSVGLPWICTLGFEMGSSSFVFDTPGDLKTAFEIFGINADLSDVADGTVCISTALANQYGLKKGDVIDSNVREGFLGSYRIAALTDDDSFIVFYVEHFDNEGIPLRLNVLGKELSGDDLYRHIMEMRGDRKADISEPAREGIDKQFAPFILIFGAGIVLLSLILSVIVNSVITGQFIERRFEFGVFRAIGMSKGEVYRKIAMELLVMDYIAAIAGICIILVFTFLMNELVYIPHGQYLPYYSDMGLYAFLISNALVMIPTILLKGRSMSKCDVTEF
jgi:ABC-type antimicrobial peptide transport system permease subunit